MQVELDPKLGTLTFFDPKIPGIRVHQARSWVRYTTQAGRNTKVFLQGAEKKVGEQGIFDVHGPGRQIIVQTPPGSEGIELIYWVNFYEQHPFALVRLSARNLSSHPLHLQEFCVCEADPFTGGKLAFDEPEENLRVFKVSWHGWGYTGVRRAADYNSSLLSDRIAGVSYSNPVTARPTRRGEFWSEGWGMIAGEQKAIVAGFTSTAHQFGQLYACILPGRVALRLVTQLDGIRLDPGEACDSEWGYLELRNLPDPDPSTNLIQAVARQMNARVPASPPPPMWTHWYHFYHDISAELFLENLESLSGLQADVPFQVAELDDGYQSAWGDWTMTNAKFPSGLEDLALKVRQKGFIPGLWLAPFVVEPRADVVRQHPDWLLRRPNGKPTSAGFLYNMFIQALDSSHPGVLEHTTRLIDRITQQWGYRMIKVDFLNAAALPGKRYDAKSTRAESLRKGLEAIRQGAGEETFLLASGCPFGPAVGIVDAMRIGPDTAPSWEPYFHWMKWAGRLIRNEPSMPALRNAIRNTLNLSTLHQRWWWNDPDCLLARESGTRLSEAEVQSAVTLVGMSGGMLVSSDDLRSLSRERLRWISLLIPNLGLRGSAIDCLDSEMPENFVVHLVQNDEAWHLVAAFNWADQPGDCRVDFTRLGYRDDDELEVYDFWGRQYLRLTGKEIAFSEVPAHGCKLLRVCKASRKPHIVGDRLHISQGREIAGWNWAENKLKIETLDLGRKVEGELVLWLPEEPRRGSCNGEGIEIFRVGEQVYAVQVKFFGRGVIDLLL